MNSLKEAYLAMQRNIEQDVFLLSLFRTPFRYSILNKSITIAMTVEDVHSLDVPVVAPECS